MKLRPGYWAAILALNIVLAGGVGLPGAGAGGHDRRSHRLRVRWPAPARTRLPVQHLLLSRARPEAAGARPSDADRPLAGIRRGRQRRDRGRTRAAPPAAARPALLASILFQTSFAATFAVFDPFTPDPAVFLAAALLTLAWLRDWPFIAGAGRR